jgi:hypothetical protein
MKSKFLCLSFVVVLGLSASSFATLWNGSAGDGLWKTGSNWDGGSAPTTGNATFYYHPGQSVTIDSGTAATCGTLEGLGWYGNPNQGVLTVQAGGSLTTTTGIILGQGGPSKLVVDGGIVDATPGYGYIYVGHDSGGVLQMNSGSFSVYTLYVTVASGSGHIQLDGGLITVTNWMSMNSYGNMDITNGTMRCLYLAGTTSGSIGYYQGLVDSGKITAFGGSKAVSVAEVTDADGRWTYITAVPEPMTMSLLGLGALSLIRRK